MAGIDVVVGGQFGSEGKGHVTQQIARAHQALYGLGTVLNVRVAGPNAGHTAYDAAGRKWALRQVPVGVTIGTRLMIAAGSEIDPIVLLGEVEALKDAGLLKEGQLVVDPEVTVIDEVHHRIEERDQLDRNGSTVKGIGAARADRLLRKATLLSHRTDLIAMLGMAGVRVTPTTRILREWTISSPGKLILVEGTQGYGLGLHSGYYPYTTSSDCRAVDFLAMAGINPWWGGGARHGTGDFRIWVVLRPYPIRIAGNSGPLRNEATWGALGLPEEITTVTKKVRRVGVWDAQLAHAAVAANGGVPTVRAAMTMLDQVFPGIEGPNGWDDAVHEWLKAREEDIECPIELVTINPTEAVWR